MTSSSPLKQIMAIRRDEMPQTLLMSSYFFLVIATFWVLRPLKTGLFIQFYDQRVFNFLAWEFNAAQAQNLAKVGNMIVAIFAATAFVYLSRYFRRQRLTYIFAGFSVICFAILAGLLNEPGSRAVWTFYWWGDLYNTLMVASFFAFFERQRFAFFRKAAIWSGRSRRSCRWRFRIDRAGRLDRGALSGELDVGLCRIDCHRWRRCVIGREEVRTGSHRGTVGKTRARFGERQHGRLNNASRIRFAIPPGDRRRRRALRDDVGDHGLSVQLDDLVLPGWRRNFSPSLPASSP